MKNIILLLIFITKPLFAEDPFGAKKALCSKFPGGYVGIYFQDAEKIKYGLQMFALGDGKIRAVGCNGGLPGDGFKKRCENRARERKDNKEKKGTERIVFQNDDEEAIADLKDGRLIGREDRVVIARLKKVVRKKPVIEIK